MKKYVLKYGLSFKKRVTFESYLYDQRWYFDSENI
jgi:hypothetical protein